MLISCKFKFEDKTAADYKGHILYAKTVLCSEKLIRCLTEPHLSTHRWQAWLLRPTELPSTPAIQTHVKGKKEHLLLPMPIRVRILQYYSE